jgi:hypothetical protein
MDAPRYLVCSEAVKAGRPHPDVSWASKAVSRLRRECLACSVAQKAARLHRDGWWVSRAVASRQRRRNSPAWSACRQGVARCWDDCSKEAAKHCRKLSSHRRKLSSHRYRRDVLPECSAHGRCSGAMIHRRALARGEKRCHSMDAKSCRKGGRRSSEAGRRNWMDEKRSWMGEKRNWMGEKRSSMGENDLLRPKAWRSCRLLLRRHRRHRRRVHRVRRRLCNQKTPRVRSPLPRLKEFVSAWVILPSPG